ncbi:MAG: Clp protease N-terminal domain-containing protein [Solirubrobacteraceae bacterium]
MSEDAATLAARAERSSDPTEVTSSPARTREEPQVMITGAARDVVARARREATRLGEREVQPAHLLLALLEAPAGLAREALTDLGVDAKRTRRLIERETATAGAPPTEPLAVSAATRVVLEGSLAESQRLCHGHLGPEHLLLALLRDDEGPAAELLVRLGAAPADLEDAVCNVLKRADFARSL